MESILEKQKKTYEAENQKLFQVVTKFQNGDEQSFEQVYKLSEKYIYSIIYRIVHDNDKTADLMQETYLQIYKKIDTLKTVETFLVWAGRIATNMTLRFIQKDSKEVLSTEENNDFIFEKASDDKEEFLPEDIMLNKEKKNKILDIINNLSEEQKVTVQYYYLIEMSVSEIAEVMQCSTGTVKSRLNYARKNIKKAVLDTEKREGIELYSLSGLPLLILLFHEEVAYAAVPSVVSASVAKGISETAGTKIVESAGKEIVEVGKRGVKEVISKLLETTGGKVASGVAVSLLAGTVAITQIPKIVDEPKETFNDVEVAITQTPLIEENMDGIEEESSVTSTQASKTLFVSPDSLISYSASGNSGGRHAYHNESSYLIDDLYLIFQDKEGKQGIYTINGEEVLPTEFDEISYGKHTGSLFKVIKGDKEAYYDKSGTMVCDNMYDYVSDVVDGLFYGVEGNKYTVYSVEGYQISNSTFDRIVDMVNGLVVVMKENEDGSYVTGLLGKDGEFKIDMKDHYIYLGDGEYIVIEDGISNLETKRMTVLDNSGNIIKMEDMSIEYSFRGGFYNGIIELASIYASIIGYNISFPLNIDGTILFNPVGTDYIYENISQRLLFIL